MKKDPEIKKIEKKYQSKIEKKDYIKYPNDMMIEKKDYLFLLSKISSLTRGIEVRDKTINRSIKEILKINEELYKALAVGAFLKGKISEALKTLELYCRNGKKCNCIARQTIKLLKIGK